MRVEPGKSKRSLRDEFNQKNKMMKNWDAVSE